MCFVVPCTTEHTHCFQSVKHVHFPAYHHCCCVSTAHTITSAPFFSHSLIFFRGLRFTVESSYKNPEDAKVRAVFFVVLGVVGPFACCFHSLTYMHTFIVPRLWLQLVAKVLRLQWYRHRRKFRPCENSRHRLSPHRLYHTRMRMRTHRSSSQRERTAHLFQRRVGGSERQT